MAQQTPKQVSTTKPLGLRERKKLRTRVTLRKVAYELFREQGYDETTVAQIAAAAEVSPATFFRYFPTKEALVVEDDYDAVFLANIGPLDPAKNLAAQILRRGADLFDELDDEARSTELDRARLLGSSPSLRAAQAKEIEQTAAAMERSVLENATGPVDPDAVRAIVGAVVGAAMSLARGGGSLLDPGSVMNPDGMRRLAALFDGGLSASPSASPFSSADSGR
ncbi:TetR/AcrR family transcriptional regulator [Tsukamurella soli]|uniref:HTH tetR-type domain-containing protein n=1 Tax=Tsukamurella soli TaxID=644556 RepID=A0ABP8J153_9ACTN